MLDPVHEAVVKNQHLTITIVSRIIGDPKTSTGTIFKPEMGRQARIGRTSVRLQGAPRLDRRKADMKAVVGDLAQHLRRPRAGCEVLGYGTAFKVEIVYCPRLRSGSRLVSCHVKRLPNGSEFASDVDAGLAQKRCPRMALMIMQGLSGQARPDRQPGKLEMVDY